VAPIAWRARSGSQAATVGARIGDRRVRDFVPTYDRRRHQRDLRGPHKSRRTYGARRWPILLGGRRVDEVEEEDPFLSDVAGSDRQQVVDTPAEQPTSAAALSSRLTNDATPARSSIAGPHGTRGLNAADTASTAVAVGRAGAGEHRAGREAAMVQDLLSPPRQAEQRPDLLAGRTRTAAETGARRPTHVPIAGRG
jgi:hypothetical protein